MEQTVHSVFRLNGILRTESDSIHRAVEGHFHHPHGRPWAETLDQVHPMMAEIVGKSFLGESGQNDLGNIYDLRRKTGGGLHNGNSDCKSPLDDVAIL